MVLDFKVVLLMSILMFSCLVAQEDKDSEVDPPKFFLETLRNPDGLDDGFMMDEQMTLSPEGSKGRYCAPNQVCSVVKYDITGSYVSFSDPCGNCTKGYGCTFHLLNRRRCRLIYKCEPQELWLLQLTPKERKQIGRMYKFPAQSFLLQDENGQSVRELRHCPRYEFMSDYVNGRRRNVTSEQPIATVANVRFPLDDSTTEILEPLE